MKKLSDYMALGEKKDGWYGPTECHYCPACKTLHGFATQYIQRNGATWQWDGSTTKPCFMPSMNITVGPFPSGKVDRCHYILTNGIIKFQSDCTHELAGQNVPLPPIPDLYWLQAGIVTKH